MPLSPPKLPKTDHPNKPARDRFRRWPIVGAALAGLLIPGVLFAQNAGDVSRSSDGKVIHRRPPEPSAAASAEAAAETPVFIYDPGRATGLPSDMQRDGRTIAKPTDSLEPSPNEPLHTAEGLKPADAPEATPEPPPGPLSPAPTRPGGPTAPRPGEVDPNLPPEPTPEARDDVSDGPPAPSDDGAFDPTAPTDPNADPNAPDAEPPDPRDDGADPLAPPEPPAGPGETASDPRSGLGDEALPDRRTEREGRLEYTEVFDPSVVPFKRNRALDQIGPDFGLRLGERRYDKLEPVGNLLERGREVFWGSLLLEGPAGSRIPIPSVSPEGRILSYEASPQQAVTFLRDQAGNFYAVPERDGRLRLVFVTDAPGHWFSRKLPRNVRFSDIPRALRPVVPRRVATEAIEVADRLGFSTDLGFTPLLEKMVAYFRGFEPGEPPPSSGNVYRDIALGQKGICRHRSHAFVVTAQALGYAARYTFNEAHVFVEVFIPGDRPGWLRIDLGGGADELRVHNAENKGMHTPPGDDPFEQPPGFGDMAGAMRATGLPEPEPSGASGTERGPGMAAEGMPSVVPRASPIPGQVPTQTTLAVADHLVFRGDGLRVSGEVKARDGSRVDSGVVQILLVRQADGVALALLGTAGVRAGRYVGDVTIPEAQPTGDYELVVEFLGNGIHGPSVGE